MWLNKCQNSQVEDIGFSGENNIAACDWIKAHDPTGRVWGGNGTCTGARLTAKDKNSIPSWGLEVLGLVGHHSPSLGLNKPILKCFALLLISYYQRELEVLAGRPQLKKIT